MFLIQLAVWLKATGPRHYLILVKNMIYCIFINNTVNVKYMPLEQPKIVYSH